LVFDGELDSLRLRLLLAFSQNSAFIGSLHTHDDVASLVLQPSNLNDLLFEVEAPLLHALLASLVLHHVLDQSGRLLNFDRGICPAGNFYLCVWFALLHELLTHPDEPACLWRKVDHLVPLCIEVHQHRLAKVSKLHFVTQLQIVEKAQMELFTVLLDAECRLRILVPRDVVDPVNSLVVSCDDGLRSDKGIDFGFVIDTAVDSYVSNQFDAVKHRLCVSYDLVQWFDAQHQPTFPQAEAG
jgi:hypothetical protein